MIPLTDREYAEMAMRVGRLMDAHRGDNRLFNCARIALNTLNNAYRNRHKRIRQWKHKDYVSRQRNVQNAGVNCP